MSCLRLIYDGFSLKLAFAYAPVVQWIERQIADLEVVGSNPAGRTT